MVTTIEIHLVSGLALSMKYIDNREEPISIRQWNPFEFVWRIPYWRNRKRWPEAVKVSG